MRTIGLVVLCVVLVGCGGGAGGGGPAPVPGDVPMESAALGAGEVVERYRPVKARVHPLSRVERDGGAERLVVQMELIDAWGHAVKWPGVARVEVDGSPRWVDLRDGAANARAYDRITQTYVLRVPAEGVGKKHVRVVYVMGDASGGSTAVEGAGSVE